MSLPLTPSQTIGPFLAIGLPWPDGPFVVPEGTPGAITHQRPGAGRGGRAGPRCVDRDLAGGAGRELCPSRRSQGAWRGGRFRGFGRCPTDRGGRYRIITLRPGALPGPEGRTEAPHLDVSVFARGLLDRVVTRIYSRTRQRPTRPTRCWPASGMTAGPP